MAKQRRYLRIGQGEPGRATVTNTMRWPITGDPVPALEQPERKGLPQSPARMTLICVLSSADGCGEADRTDGQAKAGDDRKIRGRPEMTDNNQPEPAGKINGFTGDDFRGYEAGDVQQHFDIGRQRSRSKPPT